MLRNVKHVGDSHPYKWPKISSFLTTQTTDQMAQHLDSNEEWNVCEKIDGCNLCISDKGWIASRNKIIATIKENSLSTKFYQGAPLVQTISLYNKLCQLQSHLVDTFFLGEKDFELLAFGEFVLPGSASTSEDIYNYRRRKIPEGSVCVFALGFVFKQLPTMPFVFKHGFKVEKENPFYIVPMNNALSEILAEFNILHLRPKKVAKLHTILKNERLLKDLKDRKKEGFVLSSNNGKGYIKWKYIPIKTSYLDNQFHILTEKLNTYEAMKIVANLEFMYNEADQYEHNLNRLPFTLWINSYIEEYKECNYEKLEKAAFYGQLYYDIAFEEIERDAYKYCKIFCHKKLDPRVKIQLKNKINRQLKKTFENTKNPLYSSKK